MDFKALLKSAETIAVVGCSADPSRTSYGIAERMQQHGFRIIPVNPAYTKILGEKCYPKLTAIPRDTQVDIVDIFRNKIYTEQMVKDIVEWKALTGQKPVVWTQLDVSSPEAETLATEHDLPYIANRCIAVEYAKTGLYDQR